MSYIPPTGNSDYRLTGSAFFIDSSPRLFFQNEKKANRYLFNGTAYVAGSDFAFKPGATFDFALSGNAYIPESDFSAKVASDLDVYISERDRHKAYTIPAPVNFLIPQAVYIIKADFDGRRSANFVPTPELSVSHRSHWQQGDTRQAQIAKPVNVWF